MSENYYNILGVNETATKEEIKKAYRNLQMKNHPDRNPGNQEALNMTQKINEAYETLGDEKKKMEYDYSRENPNPFMRMGVSHSGMNMNMNSDVDDLLNMMFGGGFPGFHGANVHVFNGTNMHSMHQAMQKPVPIIKTINISMEQVLTGAKVPFDVERWIVENGNKVFENETIYVTVPQGIDDGEIIILRGKGNIINEKVKGDVKVFVKINNETNFKRSGLDLILEKTITLKDALCGFTFEIKYVNGQSYTLKNAKGNIIPAEYKKICPGMGLQREEHKGNMIIHFHVIFPEKLTNEQIDKLIEVL